MITSIHPDIIQNNILPRLDGTALACAAATSPLLHAEEKLWKHICIASWPSINDPSISHAISKFQSGYRSFFSDSSTSATFLHSRHYPDHSSDLISAVDIRYKNDVIYSKVEESDKFLSVDILHSKKLAVLPLNYESGKAEEFRVELEKSINLSWILIDPTQNRSLNLSSNKPILSQRNYYPDGVQLLYVTILPSRVGNPVQCRIVVTCGGKEGGKMHLTGVNMQVQDIDGNNLSYEDSLVILQGAIQSERIKQGNEKQAFEEFLKMKSVRKEKIDKRRNYMMEIISLIFQICVVFVLLCGVTFWRLLRFCRCRFSAYNWVPKTTTF